MACAKPPSPDGITTPSPSLHPAVAPVYSQLRKTEAIIETKPPGEQVDGAIKTAEEALAQARTSGIRAAELERLERRLQDLKQLRRSDSGTQLVSQPNLDPSRRKVSDLRKPRQNSARPTRKRAAGRVADALVDKSHWQHKDYCKHLVQLVQGNDSLPEKYKNQLPRDVATWSRRAHMPVA